MSYQVADSPLTSIEALLSGQAGRPPVEKWHPELSGDIDIVIQSDGQWFHEGGLIAREKLVILFSSIMRREQDGEYYLLTPVEKWRIQVEDAPFIVTDFEVLDDGLESQKIIFETNVEGKWLLSKVHGLAVRVDVKTAEPNPCLNLDRGLHAKLSRNIFYRLVDLAEQHQGELIVHSDGESFSLGRVES